MDIKNKVLLYFISLLIYQEATIPGEHVQTWLASFKGTKPRLNWNNFIVKFPFSWTKTYLF